MSQQRPPPSLDLLSLAHLAYPCTTETSVHVIHIVSPLSTKTWSALLSSSKLTPRMSVLCMFTAPEHQSLEPSHLKEQLQDTADGYKVTGTLGVQGLRTSQHSQKRSPDSGSQMPSRTPTLPLLSSFISGLGAGSGRLANLPIPSAQTLPGPYSEPRGAEMKCLAWRPLPGPAPRVLPGLPDQAAVLRPQATYCLLCSWPGLPKAGGLSSLGFHSMQYAQDCQFTCGCVGFSAQTRCSACSGAGCFHLCTLSLTPGWSQKSGSEKPQH